MDCVLISHYLNRGHSLSSLLELSDSEKLIYTMSMNLEIETINKMNGGA